LPNVTIVLDPALGLDADALARACREVSEPDTRVTGEPVVARAARDSYAFDVVMEVVLPIATNLASDALVALVWRAVKKVRGGDTAGVAVSELPAAEGEDRNIAVTERAPGDQPADDHRDRGAG
jgi:hypothetical protein